MALYGNGIGDKTAPAWKTIWERERAESERKAQVNTLDAIDCEWLMSFAREYIDAVYAYRGPAEYKGLYIGEYLDQTKRDCVHASAREQYVGDALWTASKMLRIPETALINAARIENRYYDRGGGKLLDLKRLIISQL